MLSGFKWKYFNMLWTMLKYLHEYPFSMICVKLRNFNLLCNVLSDFHMKIKCMLGCILSLQERYQLRGVLSRWKIPLDVGKQMDKGSLFRAETIETSVCGEPKPTQCSTPGKAESQRHPELHWQAEGWWWKDISKLPTRIITLQPALSMAGDAHLAYFLVIPGVGILEWFYLPLLIL